MNSFSTEKKARIDKTSFVNSPLSDFLFCFKHIGLREIYLSSYAKYFLAEINILIFLMPTVFPRLQYARILMKQSIESVLYFNTVRTYCKRGRQ